MLFYKLSLSLVPQLGVVIGLLRSWELIILLASIGAVCWRRIYSCVTGLRQIDLTEHVLLQIKSKLIFSNFKGSPWPRKCDRWFLGGILHTDGCIQCRKPPIRYIDPQTDSKRWRKNKQEKDLSKKIKKNSKLIFVQKNTSIKIML